MRSIAWKNSSVVNVCDADLIGKTLVEGELKMHISKDFYGGDLVGEEETMRLLRGSSMISLAGKMSVGIALANKLGSPQAVRVVQGVPFLMIYKF
ncbi:MAG: DUF424 domain-containing protein [Nitrososphaerota archaeon]|nr:DUF424 domain-containing protein [Nitrososphaerota archaeon]MDG6966420.1 DUF424 domain-containing protein [Nitrososphaerota archaeon]MDG6979112.1 DUF424 domain-containing protein [Nitrososphaerota archaeon]MDG7016210.1 DUF424 domain-containing protein [Nitrososphaerota archaeon]MDG7020561.1 DUF424 domain-containing protein [Nitrososphaerota archaeon]